MAIRIDGLTLSTLFLKKHLAPSQQPEMELDPAGLPRLFHDLPMYVQFYALQVDEHVSGLALWRTQRPDRAAVDGSSPGHELADLYSKHAAAGQYMAHEFGGLSRGFFPQWHCQSCTSAATQGEKGGGT